MRTLAPASPRSGFTLAELLVAVAVLVLLTMGLYGALAAAVSIWRKGESRRQTDEEGRSLLAQLATDLESVHPIDPGGTPPAGFFCRVSPSGDLLMRFVRARGGRDESIRTRRGGEGTPSEGYGGTWVAGPVSDPDERLRALGGLSEVFYFYLASTETLLRGERAPLGGTGSFFDWNAVRNVAYLESVGRPVSEHVLALEVLFWGPETTTWDPAVQPRAGGPLRSWDSSCRVEPDFPYAGDPIGARLGGGFLPGKVRIRAVIASPDGGERSSTLARPIEAGDGVLHVSRGDGFPSAEDNAFPYLKIEDEWMRYSDRSGTRFSIVERGARGTQAAAHATTRATPAGGTEAVRVRSGRPYGLTIEVPAAREDAR